MVAVTVILAAVIAAFVFGMSGNISKAHIVAASGQLSQDGQTVMITYQGGQDANQVMGLNCTANGVAVTPSFSTTGTARVPVGSTFSSTTKGHYVVTAFFADSSSSVILDSNY